MRHRDAGAGKNTLVLGKVPLYCLSPRGLERGKRVEWDKRAPLHDDRAQHFPFF